MAASSSHTHTPDSNLDSLINLMVFLFVCFSGFFFFGTEEETRHGKSMPRPQLESNPEWRCEMAVLTAALSRAIQQITKKSAAHNI